MNNVKTGQEAIDLLIEGVNLAIDPIKPTYGAKGINVIVENENYPYHEIANDAQTIIQAIQTEEPVQKRGLGLIKELMDKQDKDSGDGRKTTCIITSEIINNKSKLTGMELKKELDLLIPVVEKEIDKVKQTITEKEVNNIATIAGENKEMGNLIGEIYQKIGKEGIISPEASGTYETTYSITNGVKFNDCGFLSPAMVHDKEAVKDNKTETKAIYENPTILVTKRKIGHLNDINPLIEELNKQGKKDLVIFTDDMDSEVASIMVKAHKDKVMNILIIKASVLFKNYIFEDFSKVVGATIVEDATGINFKNLGLSHLGTCAKITVDKDETIIIPSVDFSEHIAQLKENKDNDSKLRLSWLQTKTAILKLGANSESELSYIRLKTKDAINSSMLALKDGVVKGGGVCLLNVADTLPDTEAGKILSKALKAPYIQNLKNMNIEEPNWNEDVIDSSAVIKNAVRNAVSLAGTILTCGVVVCIPKKSEEELLMMQLQAKRPF